MNARRARPTIFNFVIIRIHGPARLLLLLLLRLSLRRLRSFVSASLSVKPLLSMEFTYYDERPDMICLSVCRQKHNALVLLRSRMILAVLDVFFVKISCSDDYIFTFDTST